MSGLQMTVRQDQENEEPCRRVRSLGLEDPLEKEMVIHSSILAWGNPMDRGAWRAKVHGVTKELGHD